MMAIFKKYRWAVVPFAVLGAVLLAACSDFGYYVQSARGHMEVMSLAQPIEDLIANSATSASVREELSEVLAIRQFAVDELALPDNGSYRHYADIGRPYVIWNVVAAYEFSLKPREWCFPVAGCVSYRGYFEESDAEEFADSLEKEGMDVTVFGVPAYSTLRWFDDPVLNTFLAAPTARTAALIFHELAHQVVYVPGDSSFNEAFAKTVEMEGVRRWLQATAPAEKWHEYLERQAQVRVFQQFLQATREDLKALYQRPMGFSEKRQAKLDFFEGAGDRYRQLKESGELDNRFDHWMARGLNNARLASVATYRDFVPAFQVILERSGNDLKRFYAEVERISNYPREERLAVLRHWMQTERHAALTSPGEESQSVVD